MEYLVSPDCFKQPSFVIRSYQPGDGLLLNEASNSSYEHLKTFMAWAKPDATLEESEQICRTARGRYLLATDFTLGIFSLDEKRVLGGTGFHLREGGLSSLSAEIGMWIRGDVAGTGLGTSVLVALLDWGFSEEWPWLRLCWRCDTRNIASIRTAEKAGMQKEGLQRGVHSPLGPEMRRDLYSFSMLREEWLNTRAMSDRPGIF